MFSQTTEYALRAMVHLATAGPDKALNSETLAEQIQAPKGYLSKIMRDLVVAELVNSQRGPNGGFVLSRPASKISIYDVVEAVDPLQRITKCPLGNPRHVKLCPLHKRMDDALAMVEKEFKRTNLAQVVETNSAAGRAR